MHEVMGRVRKDSKITHIPTIRIFTVCGGPAQLRTVTSELIVHLAL